MNTRNSILFGFSLMLTVAAEAGAQAAQPDFGPNVLILEPGQADSQQRIQAVFKEQERAQFGSGRYALLFKPGRYELDVPVGFYTHVAGLGKTPGHVTIAGHVWNDAAWMNYNATCNFWRAMENLTVQPPDGTNIWAVSQAAPMRRTHIRGNLQLWSGRGGASGGFMADCGIDGAVKAGSQQQWFSRNSGWKEWTDVNWNMVFVGCENPPPGDWPQRAVSVVLRAEKARLAAEAANLIAKNGQGDTLRLALERSISEHSLSSAALCWLCEDRVGWFSDLLNHKVASAIIAALERGRAR